MKARILCTMQNSVKTIVAIYVVSILLHLCRFFENTYKAVPVESMINKGVVFDGCVQTFSPLIAEHLDIYFNMYFWMRVSVIHAIPCTTLVIFNLLLIFAMKKAQLRRKQLLKQNRRSECKRLKENNSTTFMLVAVVGLFLIVEIPLAVLIVINIVENTFGLQLTNLEHKAIAGFLINFFILLSYPLNFFIYCGMSRQFRETFKRLFVPGAQPIDREHSQYISLATENGAGGKTEAPCTKESTM